MNPTPSPADPAQVATALEGTLLAGRPIEVMAAPEGSRPALLIRCAPEEAHTAWDAARAVVPSTGRWPLLTDLIEPDLLSNRWCFRYEPDGPPVPRHERPPWRYRSVGDVLDEAQGLTGAQALQVFARPEGDDWVQPFDYELGLTAELVGSAPTEDELAAALGPDPTQLDIERHLLTWEEAHRSEPIDVGYHDLADRAIDADALILLPTEVSWEALAHVGFFGAEAHRAGPMVAVVRMWWEQYGAEVRTVWGAGTWMDFVVARPPSDLDAAFDLAVQQLAVAECTYDEITGASGLRGLARALQDSPTWALSERP